MDLSVILFYLFVAITLGGAAVVVFSRHIVRAAFALLFAFFGVAALYVFLIADFVAVTQLMIYVGGILVLIIFGVMLTQKQLNVDSKAGTMSTLPAVAIASAVAGLLIGMFWSTSWLQSGQIAPETAATGSTLGHLLLTTYLLPFEVASVILLVALIGAALIARRERTNE